ncbi:MAG: hypothetical protein P8Z36_14215 [Gemmatimonadota bacterium]|jgi:hypothetical protein
MRPGLKLAAATLVLAAAPFAARPLAAQDTAAPKPLEVGTVAPDFAVAAATRFGVLEDSVHLSDFKGKTVVLAFYVRARTKG